MWRVQLDCGCPSGRARGRRCPRRDGAGPPSHVGCQGAGRACRRAVSVCGKASADPQRAYHVRRHRGWRRAGTDCGRVERRAVPRERAHRYHEVLGVELYHLHYHSLYNTIINTMHGWHRRVFSFSILHMPVFPRYRFPLLPPSSASPSQLTFITRATHLYIFSPQHSLVNILTQALLESSANPQQLSLSNHNDHPP